MKTTSQKEQNRKYVNMAATVAFCLCFAICCAGFAYVFPGYTVHSICTALIVIIPMAITCYLDNNN